MQAAATRIFNRSCILLVLKLLPAELIGDAASLVDYANHSSRIFKHKVRIKRSTPTKCGNGLQRPVYFCYRAIYWSLALHTFSESCACAVAAKQESHTQDHNRKQDQSSFFHDYPPLF